jgi:putative aldouronate transport system permease protein
LKTAATASLVGRAPSGGLRQFGRTVWKYRWIYLLMVLPTMVLIVVFRYLTLPGIGLAFMEFRPLYRPEVAYEGPAVFRGLVKFFATLAPGRLFGYFTTSEWVGLGHFQRLLSESNFVRAFTNTLVLSLMKLAIAFPFTIVLALMINEIRARGYRRVLQTVFTFPHFLSWVVVAGIILNLFGDTGAVKKIFIQLAPRIAAEWNVLYDPALFRWNMILTEMWKEAGWGTILYLGAMAGIDPALYEAATIDGCGRLAKIRHITLPGISGVVVIMFLLHVGNMVNANFDQVFNLYTPQTYATGDVIDTYIYRQSFQSSTVSDFGFTTAVGLFKSVINFVLLVGANTLARRVSQVGIL